MANVARGTVPRARRARGHHEEPTAAQRPHVLGRDEAHSASIGEHAPLASALDGALPAHLSRRRPRGSEADLKALVRAYGIRHDVFITRELVGEALRTVGYEIELHASARPLMRLWYGNRAATALLQDALVRVAEGLTARACCAYVHAPEPSRRRFDPAAPIAAHAVIELRRHEHHAASDMASPCLAVLRRRLERLEVPALVD